jgi:hypothetical protein
MEFEISITSIWNDTKPCEEAYKKQIVSIDERAFKTFEEHDKRLPRDKKWLEEGFNHKIISANNKFDCQHIYREFNDEIWCIKINSLKELLELQDKYGDIILSTSFKNDNIRKLEIYDDYRE